MKVIDLVLRSKWANYWIWKGLKSLIGDLNILFFPQNAMSKLSWYFLDRKNIIASWLEMLSLFVLYSNNLSKLFPLPTQLFTVCCNKWIQKIYVVIQYWALSQHWDNIIDIWSNSHLTLFYLQNCCVYLHKCTII